MIIDNTSLGFGGTESDCRGDDFCQTVIVEDNPQWQLAATCSELTGGTQKMPCESNQIGSYTDDFHQYNNLIPITEASPQFVISSTAITITGLNTGNNLARAFLEPNTCYIIRFTITEYQIGFVLLTQNYSDPATTETFSAAGTYTRVFCTDSTGEFNFQFGDPLGETPLTTLTVSNIFIGCIRYAQLYNIVYEEGDEGAITYSGQTIFVKEEATVNDVKVDYGDPSIFREGLEYKFCFTISECTAGEIAVTIGDDTFTYTTNGTYCETFVFSQAVLPNVFGFNVSNDFIGKFGDIEVHLVPEIRARLVDCEGEEIEVGLVTEVIENTLKVSLGTVPDGCYNIQVADSCSNYRKQFYGSVFDAENKYSETINTTTGAWTAGEPNDEGNWEQRIKFIDVLCCEKIYSGNIQIGFAGGEELPVLNFFDMTIIMGGTQYSYSATPTDPVTPNPFNMPFTNIVAGCENADIEIVFTYNFTAGDGLFVGTMYLENNGVTYIEMNEGQFCPEFTSRCLKIQAQANCKDNDTVLIKYRNPNNCFGFDYTTEGYTEADGFYNMLRIPAKVWKANYPKTKSIQKNSTGFRTLYYSDVDKKFILNTKPLPEAIHDALSIALEHTTLIIDGAEYVCPSEDYSPDWTKGSALAPVEVELFAQQARKVNTRC